MTFPLYTLCAAQREAQSCVCVCVRARPHHTRMLKWSCCSFYIIVHCYLLLNESPFFFPPSDWSELVSVVNETHSDVFHVCVELSSYCPSVERLVSFLEAGSDRVIVGCLIRILLRVYLSAIEELVCVCVCVCLGLSCL